MSDERPKVYKPPTTAWPTLGSLNPPPPDAAPAVPSAAPVATAPATDAYRHSGRVGVLLMHRGDPASTADAKGWVRRWYADPAAFSSSFGRDAQGLLANVFSRFDTRGVEQRMQEIGGTSPVHRQLEALSTGLQQRLNGEREGTAAAQYLVRAATLYGAPTVADALKTFRAEGLQRVVAISLYPQRCDRFFKPLKRALDAESEGLEVSLIDRFPTAPAYVEALKKSIEAALFRASDATVVFCAVPIERKDEEAGDPYPDQLKLTTTAVMEQLPSPWKVSWLDTGAPGLPTDVLLARLRSQSVKSVVLVPLGTVVDELDVVHALDVRLRPLARQQGFAHVERAAAVCSEPQMLELLETELHAHLQRVASLGFDAPRQTSLT